MRILKSDCIALVIDIQQKLFPHINLNAELEQNTLKLIKGLKTLNIPIVLTEQYPKGLGKTIASVTEILSDLTVFEKTSFSCIDNAAILKQLQAIGKRNVIICGIETHVCVLQTVIDLLAKNFCPVVIADCVASRKEQDKNTALLRMQSEGAIITSYESVLFELVRTADASEFKQISAIVK